MCPNEHYCAVIDIHYDEDEYLYVFITFYPSLYPALYKYLLYITSNSYWKSL